jgi:hypothetical protein
MDFKINWEEHPYLFILYFVCFNIIYEYIIKEIIKKAFEKYIGTAIVANLLSRTQNKILITVLFFGAKKSEPYLGLLPKSSSEGLDIGKVQNTLFNSYVICRSNYMVNDNVQSFLFQNAFKVSSQFNYTNFFEESESSISKVVSDTRVTGIESQEIIEYNPLFLDLIKQVRFVISPLFKRLANGDVAYFCMIAYGASVGGVFEQEIYSNCLQIAQKLCFENLLLQNNFTDLEINEFFIDVVSLLLPTPALRNQFDELLELQLDEIKQEGQRIFLKSFCLNFLLNFNSEVKSNVN